MANNSDLTLALRITADGQQTRREIQSIRDALRQQTADIQRANTQAQQNFQLNARESTAYLRQIRDATRETVAQLQQLNSAANGLQNLNRNARAAAESQGALASATKLVVGYLGTRAIIDAGRGYADFATQIDRVNRLTLASAGNQQAAQASMIKARDIAERYGQSVLGIAESYGRFSIAVKGSALEGAKADALFTAVAKAAGALGLRVDDTGGILRAFEQIIGKGTIQAEEWRGQIGDRLPGAMQILQRATGKSTAELMKMMEQGQLLADEVLPKVTAELEKTYGAAKFTGPAAEIERLKNAWIDLKKEFVDTDFVGNAAKTIADRIKDITGTLNSNQALQNVQRDIAKIQQDRLQGRVSTATGTLIENPTDAEREGQLQRLNSLLKQELDLIRQINKETGTEAARQGRLGSAANVNLGGYQGGGLGDQSRYRVAPGKDAAKRRSDSNAAYIEQLIIDAAKSAGVDPALALAIAQTESGKQQYRADGSVKLGPPTKYGRAVGMFQLLESTARSPAAGRVNPFDQGDNIRGGTNYLAYLQKLYAGDPQALLKVIYAYSAGPGNLEKRGLANPPAETRKYIANVLADMKQEAKDANVAGAIVSLDDYRANLKEAEQLFSANQARIIALAKTALDSQKNQQEQTNAEIDRNLQARADARAKLLVGLTGNDRAQQEAANAKQAAQDEAQAADQRAAAAAKVLAAEESVARAKLAALEAARAQEKEFGASDAERVQRATQIKEAEQELINIEARRGTLAVETGSKVAQAVAQQAAAYDDLKQAQAEARAELERRQSDAVVIDQLAKELAARGATVDEIKRQIDATRELLTLQAKFPGEAALEAQLKATQAAEQAADRTVDAASQQAQLYEEIWKQAARNVQNALANMLEGILTGQAKSFDDLISGLGQSLASITANVASTAISGVFKDIAGSLSSGGNLFDSIGTAFGKLSGEQIGSLSTVGIAALGNLIPTAGNRYTRNKGNEQLIQMLRLGGYIPGQVGTALGGAALGGAAGLYFGSLLYPDRKASTAGAAAGIGTGAALGTIIYPGIGTIVGALIGAIAAYVGGDVVKSQVVGEYSKRKGALISATSNAGGIKTPFVDSISAITSNLNRAANLLEVEIPKVSYRFDSRGDRFQLTRFDPKSGETLYQGNKRHFKESTLNEELDAFLGDVVRSRSVLRQIPDVLVRGAVRNSGRFSDIANNAARAYKVEEYTGARTGLASQLAQMEQDYRSRRQAAIDLTSGGPKSDRVAQVRLVDEAYRDKFATTARSVRDALLDLSGKSRPVTESIKAITDQFKVLRVQNEELARSAKRTGQEYQKVTEAEFAQAQAAAIGKLRQNLVNALREASGESSPLVEGLISLRAQFNQMREDAKALNVDLADVNAAEKKAVERLISEMTGGAVGQLIANIRAQADALRGGPSALARVQSDIAAQYAALAGAGDLRAQQDAVSKLSNLIAKRYQLELEAVNAQIQAAQQLKEYVDSLKLSDLSTLTPTQRYEQAKGQYGQALLKAQAGDASALQGLPQLAQQYLQETRSYAPGSLYPQVFEQVQAELNQALRNAGLSSPDEIERKLNSVQTGANTELAGLADRLQKIADAMAASAGQTAASVDASTTQIVNAVSAQSQAVTQALIGAKGSVGAGVNKAADAIEELRKDTVAIAYKQGVRIR